MFKALAHPARRQVMALLKQGPKTSGEIAEAVDAAWPTVSRHLNVLKEADLISAERDGNSILYRANASVLEEAAGALLALLRTDNGDDDMQEAAE
ncbi:MAG: metalloregulator ArsR/SmtB family transcription factor [Pseudomonadota bacterium]